MPTEISASATSPSMPITRRRVIRDRDPNLHYRWVRGTEDRIEQLREDAGYEVVQTKDGKPRKSGGDVLMACPRELYDARKRHRDKQAAEHIRGPKEAFSAQAMRHAVPVVDQSKVRVSSMQDEIGQGSKGE